MGPRHCKRAEKTPVSIFQHSRRRARTQPRAQVRAKSQVRTEAGRADAATRTHHNSKLMRRSGIATPQLRRRDPCRRRMSHLSVYRSHSRILGPGMHCGASYQALLFQLGSAREWMKLQTVREGLIVPRLWVCLQTGATKELSRETWWILKAASWTQKWTEVARRAWALAGKSNMGVPGALLQLSPEPSGFFFKPHLSRSEVLRGRRGNRVTRQSLHSSLSKGSQLTRSSSASSPQSTSRHREAAANLGKAG